VAHQCRTADLVLAVRDVGITGEADHLHLRIQGTDLIE
jgi:hypothetical protein